jgi:dienelactone hydrolase
MKRLATILFVLAAAAADDPTRVLESGKKLDDVRLGPPRDLYKSYFPMTPPVSKEEWAKRRQGLREQVLVAVGLWPLPEKTPLHAVIHGKIDRDEYTIEKVFFASYPGHYVSGNLYRPKGKEGKRPGVLCPHGHWKDGRFFDAGEAEVQRQIKQGAEKTAAGARHPLQARCAQLARMGCVVFHYDMVGVADSQPIGHRAGFTDAEAGLRQQNFMGLQTWNSVRALDFLLSLPDVDATRIGVTGASGGGTQTFMLGAVDDRPTVAFPAVMVSTAMQGGCVCENASYLRVGAGNIDLAGLFAPKPMSMSCADDWTINIERKGLPELKALYKLYGAEDRVAAKCFPQFKHNYNQVSRELMYNWFNKHLKLGQPEPVREKPFEPVPPKELSVYDAEHPRPADAADPERLRQYLTAANDRQMAALLPKDAEGLEKFRNVIGTALRVMVHDRLPRQEPVDVEELGTATVQPQAQVQKLLLSPKGSGERVPAVLVSPAKSGGTVVVWVHPEGKGSLLQGGALAPAARKILDRDAAILAVDTLCTGESDPARRMKVDAHYAGFTFGYNRPLLGDRVHDVLTAVAYAKDNLKAKAIHLVGFDKAGPWVVLARGLCGDAVVHTAADLNGFRFEQVKSTADEMMLPGALKYGGLPAFAALAAPGEVYLHNLRGTASDSVAKAAYQAARAPGQLRLRKEKDAPEQVVEWLLR